MLVRLPVLVILVVELVCRAPEVRLRLPSMVRLPVMLRCPGPAAALVLPRARDEEMVA